MDPLVTPEELASYLQRDPLDRATAEIAVAGASGIVRGYCRWLLSRAEETFVLDGSGSTVLSLPTLYLVDVVQVRIDDAAIDPADPGTAAATEYTWSDRGQLHRAAGWPKRFRCVEVDAIHGYDPAPDEVRLVTLARAAREYDNPARRTTRTVGAISHGYDLSEFEMSQLVQYRLP